jgi:hypothetical protein
MPRYEVTTPDGRQFEITVQAGTSQAEASAYTQTAVAKPAPATLKQPIKIEDVLQALRNADAAGDIEAATHLAQLAVRLRPDLAPPAATPTAKPLLSGGSFATQAGVPIQIDVEKAAGNAVISISVGALLCVVIFGFFLRRLWRKPKTTPHQTGLWWGSNLALLAMLKSVAQLVTPLFLAYEPIYTSQFINQTLNVGLISMSGFFFLGYIVGWLFRRLKPLPTQLDKSALHQEVKASTPVISQTHPSDAFYAQAMSELETQSNSMDRGLWARCYAEAGGLESTAKAHYLRERAKLLASQSPP